MPLMEALYELATHKHDLYRMGRNNLKLLNLQGNLLIIQVEGR